MRDAERLVRLIKEEIVELPPPRGYELRDERLIALGRAFARLLEGMNDVGCEIKLQTSRLAGVSIYVLGPGKSLSVGNIDIRNLVINSVYVQGGFGSYTPVDEYGYVNVEEKIDLASIDESNIDKEAREIFKRLYSRAVRQLKSKKTRRANEKRISDYGERLAGILKDHGLQTTTSKNYDSPTIVVRGPGQTKLELDAKQLHREVPEMKKWLETLVEAIQDLSLRTLE